MLLEGGVSGRQAGWEESGKRKKKKALEEMDVVKESKESADCGVMYDGKASPHRRAVGKARGSQKGGQPSGLAGSRGGGEAKVEEGPESGSGEAVEQAGPVSGELEASDPAEEVWADLRRRGLVFSPSKVPDGPAQPATSVNPPATQHLPSAIPSPVKALPTSPRPDPLPRAQVTQLSRTRPPPPVEMPEDCSADMDLQFGGLDIQFGDGSELPVPVQETVGQGDRLMRIPASKLQQVERLLADEVRRGPGRSSLPAGGPGGGAEQCWLPWGGGQPPVQGGQPPVQGGQPPVQGPPGAPLAAALVPCQGSQQPGRLRRASHQLSWHRRLPL
jgi:hypothetical protein